MSIPGSRTPRPPRARDHPNRRLRQDEHAPPYQGSGDLRHGSQARRLEASAKGRLASRRRLGQAAAVDWVERLRAVIAELPETSEKLSHGAPTWWGGRKTFATYHDGHYDDGRPAVWIKAPSGVQELLIADNPARFYRPKYLGPAGWVGVRLDDDVEWEEVRELLLGGYRTVAPKRALKALGLDEN